MSLREQYDRDNVFAKIIRGEIPSTKIMETQSILAIMDAFPQSDGHALVIHKQAQSTNLLNFPTDSLGTIMECVQRIARASEMALAPDGIRIAQFNGAAAGQTVFHTHFPIIPVYSNAPLGDHASGDAAASTERLSEIAEKIKAAL